MEYKKIITLPLVFAALSMSADIKPDVSAWPEPWRKHKLTEFDVQMAIDAVNGKNEDGTQWTGDWNDPNQEKWRLWYVTVPSKTRVSGRGLSLNDVYYVYTFTGVGPRLVFRSRAHAMHFHEHFLWLYENYYLGEA